MDLVTPSRSNGLQRSCLVAVRCCKPLSWTSVVGAVGSSGCWPPDAKRGHMLRRDCFRTGESSTRCLALLQRQDGVLVSRLSYFAVALPPSLPRLIY